MFFFKKNGAQKHAPKKLLSEFQLLNDSAVSFDVFAFKIVEHVAALTDHHQQTFAAVVVFLVRREMRGEFVDTSGEKRDLYFG